MSYGNFALEKEKKIDEIGMTLRELVHQGCGARVIHLENPEDRENLFSLNFQTLPDCSDGVAHVLEHTVLCGSKKFPVRDPFFSMIRRSLNTFMNAMTGADFTCYPAASKNETDFYNLLDVYLDAVFHPLLDERNFFQEGHHLAFAKSDDISSGLVNKGVVFNEMKGALSTPESRLWEAVNSALMPDITYGVNSGGEPKEIVNLTCQKLRDFHAKYYDPSRCVFFFYGDIPLQKHLDFIEKKVLASAKKLPPLPPIPKQKRFVKPVQKELLVPAEEGRDLSKECRICFSWLTTEIKNQDDVLAIQLLVKLLLDTDASPLNRALLDSKLCQEAFGYIDHDISEIPFYLVCRGCKKESRDAIYKVIETKLEELCEKGFNQDLIDGALHQMEFSRCEIKGGRSPYGLTLLFRSALLKMHACNPENGLVIQSLFDGLREKLKNRDFLPNLIRKYLLDNPHRVDLTCIPDASIASKEEKEEAEKLKEIESKLSQEEKEAIVARSKKLEEYQRSSENEDLSCLPKVSLKDIPENPEEYPLQTGLSNETKTFHHNATTNGIVYASLNLNLPDLSEEEIDLLPYFIEYLSEVGVGKKTFEEQLTFHNNHFGNFGAGTHLYAHIDRPDEVTPTIWIGGKALYHHTETLFHTISDTLHNVRFDETARIKELIAQDASALKSGINHNAMRYAQQMCFANLCRVEQLKNEWSGLPALKKCIDLEKNVDARIEALQERLVNFRDKIVSCQNPELVVTCDQNHFDKMEKAEFYDLKSIAASSDTPWRLAGEKSGSGSQIFETSASVAFNCQGFNTVHYTHPDSAALLVASELMKLRTLHPEIREKGGAYGSNASYMTKSGIFLFSSYRDPHIERTFDVFKKAANELVAGNFTDDHIEEAILSIVQDLDAPVSPGSRGNLGYSLLKTGRIFETRKAFRNSLLNVDKESLIRAVQTHLLDNWKSSVKISFASSQLIKEQKPSLPIAEPIFS